MRHFKLAICIAVICQPLMSLPVFAETLTYREARKALPRANAKAAISFNVDVVPAKDRAQLVGAKQKLEDVLAALGAAVPAYGALAISPSEGLFVQWLNGAGRFHSIQAARSAALSYCNAKRGSASARCEIAIEVRPKGAKQSAALTLSGPANAALRGSYRRLKAPKAFAISDKTGNFGFDRGDGGRALEACASAGSGASDCRIVVAD